MGASLNSKHDFSIWQAPTKYQKKVLIAFIIYISLEAAMLLHNFAIYLNQLISMT